MYLARFSYNIKPVDRDTAMDLLGQSVTAAGEQGHAARLLVPLTRSPGGPALQVEVEFDTLDAFENFRLIRYSQADAVFTGFEGEIRHRLTPWLTGELFGDYVKAEFDDAGGNVPRIPAARLGARAEVVHGAWSGDLEAGSGTT